MALGSGTSPAWTLPYAALPATLHLSGIRPGWGGLLKNPPRFVAQKVVTWSWKLGTYLGERYNGYWLKEKRENRERQVDQTHWRGVMREIFWNDVNQQMDLMRAQAFDRLTGHPVSQGFVPPLRDDAALAWVKLTNEISDRSKPRWEEIRSWEAQMQAAMHGAEERFRAEAAELRRQADGPPEPSNAGHLRSRAAYLETLTATNQPAVHHARAQIERLLAENDAELAAVVELEMNPANWKVSAGQLEKLPDEWQELFARRDELESKLAQNPHNNPARAQLAAVQQQMADQAWNLYDFGPTMSPDDQRQAYGDYTSRYGPQPPQYGPPAP